MAPPGSRPANKEVSEGKPSRPLSFPVAAAPLSAFTLSPAAACCQKNGQQNDTDISQSFFHHSSPFPFRQNRQLLISISYFIGHYFEYIRFFRFLSDFSDSSISPAHFVPIAARGTSAPGRKMPVKRRKGQISHLLCHPGYRLFRSG